MNLFQIAWRSVAQRRLASILTGVSMALGVALIVAVLVIYGTVRESFTRSAQGYHLIVGAKGGRLQLVLNTVFHLSQPIENIPYSYYKEFTEGRFASASKLAIPYCLGDNYQGFRVVGTTPQMFEDLEYAPGKRYAFQSGGRNFKQENFFEAVIGSIVAHRTGLKVGDQFQPTHGISTEEGQGHKHDAFTVVGILEPTGTPNDRALFVNMEGFYLLDGHAKPVESNATRPTMTLADRGTGHAHDGDAPQDHAHGDEEHAHEHEGHDHAEGDRDQQQEGREHDDHEHSHAHEHAGHEHEHGEHDHDQHQPLPEEQREVTAILVLASNDVVGQSLFRAVNKGQVAQAAYPAAEVTNLFQGIVGNLQILLLVLTVLIVVVAGIGIMVSIYNSMSERTREIAVMRALGARRGTVMSIVLLESILISLGGGLAGVLLGHGLIGALSPLIVAQTGVSIGFLQFEWNELILIPGLICLAALAGYLPALAAYRTDVAKALSANP